MSEFLGLKRKVWIGYGASRRKFCKVSAPVRIPCKSHCMEQFFRICAQDELRVDGVFENRFSLCANQLTQDEVRVDGVFEVPDENVRGTNFPILGYLFFKRHPLSAGYRDHTSGVRHPVNKRTQVCIYNERIYT